MPVISTVDWTAAKLLRARGLSDQAIANEIGATRSAVKARRTREKWDASVAKASNIAIQCATYESMTSLKARADKFVRKMADDVDETVDIIRNQKKPKSLQKILERESALEKLNKRARLTYGLDTGESGGSRGLVTNVQVNVVGGNSGSVPSASGAEKPAIESSTGPVIDVSSEPEA